ncbi:autophagy-related protein 9 [Westerdykella ornata]|uniref:Autophagy-related protein 9 n=1 Tax=Westerdykella ornata TaxID=318751 RepID=A0A6A6JF26_WESOR|nr:autophagy-related protein 9 [Westerdykella ornata]KAF2274844.1 autophagy-related protein 9 [Westerdykella ornata]
MASNLLSKLLPSASDGPFETDISHSHRERRASSSDDPYEMDIDEENFGARFEEQDLENLLADAQSTTATSNLHPNDGGPAGWSNRAPHAEHPYDDDDVPESLLLEGEADKPSSPPRSPPGTLPPPVPGPSTRQNIAQWEATKRHQRLHHEERRAAPVPSWRALGRHGVLAVDPKEKAMWRWVNVSDMDAFMSEVYAYYTGHGIKSILLRKTLALVQTTFVVGYLTFLSYCIDYKSISHSHKMSEVLVPQCMKKIHGIWIFGLWLFILYTLYALVKVILDIPELKAMHDFYHYLLDIPDRDIQSVQWQHVVGQIMSLRDLNLTTASNLSPEARKLVDHRARQRLDAVDIASRLLRQDNYMIALFNKEILDVGISIPFVGKRYVFSETTQWHVRLAILDFVFSGPNNSFNKDFLSSRNRRELVRRLQARFFWVGVISIIYTPFLVTFVLASYLFKYFTEYRKDPSILSTRDFTPFAQWKFREFNELPHLFIRRKNMALECATYYLDQFPKDKSQQVATFISFVAGAFAFVLGLITVFDSELFLNFEIGGRTALFWLGLLTTVYLAARSSSPKDGHVPVPEYYLEMVNQYTHYEPPTWKGKLHSDEVRAEFSELFQLKILIFAEEILSMVITPFLLMFRLPGCSDRIVDFFREFSIHVDGLGVVCSYSMFPFNKGTRNGGAGVANQAVRRDTTDPRAAYFNTKDDKMLRSYYGFLDTYSTNGRVPHARENFHPPPQFPNAFGMHMSGTAHPLDPNPRAHLPFHQLAQRLNAVPVPKEPVLPPKDESYASALLDPRHHPNPAALRASPLQAPRYRPSHLMHNVAESPRSRLGLSRQQSSSRVEEESTLGESWRMGRMAAAEDEEDDEIAEGQKGGKREGLLQVLMDFGNAQATGKGVSGVEI